MSFLESLSGSAMPEKPQCSRKACRAEAHWQLRWNNPAVHSPERLKVWLACDEHREWLENYLRVRGFFRDTVPFSPSLGEV